jgi:hypothetical protein
MDIKTSTITLTFGDQAENNIGMQKIGSLANHGFFYQDLVNAQNKIPSQYKTELIHLNEHLPKEYQADDAYILIIRKGIDYLLSPANATDLFNEQANLDVDKKAFMKGRVVNKIARYNLCFADYDQEPDYNNKKGRIINFTNMKYTNMVRDKLENILGSKAKKLMGEGNYYYDVSKCGIGFHGDTERKKVVGVRLGASMSLEYQWFYQGNPVGKRIKLMLDNGDFYVMSEKAVGTDWKKKIIPTLRHAAGCDKFLQTK